MPVGGVHLQPAVERSFLVEKVEPLLPAGLLLILLHLFVGYSHIRIAPETYMDDPKNQFKKAAIHLYSSRPTLDQRIRNLDSKLHENRCEYLDKHQECVNAHNELVGDVLKLIERVKELENAADN